MDIFEYRGVFALLARERVYGTRFGWLEKDGMLEIDLSW